MYETWAVLSFVAVVVVLPFVILALLCFFVLVLVRLLRGPQRSRTLDAEEARSMQELHRGLSDFEKRIENLETILLDKETEHGRQE